MIESLIRGLAEKYLPYFFAENPVKENTVLVQNAFSELLRRSLHLKPNNFFHRSISLDLKLRNGSYLPSLLYFYADDDFDLFDDYETEPIRLNLDLTHGDNRLSSRQFFTSIKYPNRKKVHVLITSYSLTSVGWEGNGFGTALINLTDPTIKFAMKHFKIWDGLPIKARISDRSRGRLLKNRNGWTTIQAGPMKYRKFRNEEFIKWYRK